MIEPGLDRHDWESEWSSLEDDLRDAPEETLPLVHDLVGRMLREREILDDNLVATEGADPELLRPWEQSSESVERISAGEDIDPGDVGQTVDNLRGLYETLIASRTAP